ncbi:uncharacterized protein BDR25DRAFT_352240 [Lindgomyces ingoldianus]|uniref:Uncharacterized protein n=1 Tax=Lindgomyces ingoldianus TaxID=673940 RepID=A0ACB6R3J0_9PLEO|nr:uncharacterized protein BDR25DRAFT_352240 [Lindgomyces ingoldianus]KAF2473746.1 hypothetical protein BDR25DRAFT_352240 [Lindgomyces ingoldianus]
MIDFVVFRVQIFSGVPLTVVEIIASAITPYKNGTDQNAPNVEKILIEAIVQNITNRRNSMSELISLHSKAHVLLETNLPPECGKVIDKYKEMWLSFSGVSWCAIAMVNTPKMRVAGSLVTELLLLTINLRRTTLSGLVRNNSRSWSSCIYIFTAKGLEICIDQGNNWRSYDTIRAAVATSLLSSSGVSQTT